MLTRTSALLPHALFASLGLPRADEGVGDAKLSVDQGLKRTCEEVIGLCADAPARPLREWAARVRAYTNPSTSSTSDPGQAEVKANVKGIGEGMLPAAFATQEWAALAAVEALDDAFRASCESALRAAAARVALYLEEPRTVSVLLAHVRERVTGDYANFAEVAKGLHGVKVSGKLMGSGECTALIRRACEVEGI